MRWPKAGIGAQCWRIGQCQGNADNAHCSVGLVHRPALACLPRRTRPNEYWRARLAIGDTLKVRMKTASEYVNTVLLEAEESRPVLCDGRLDQPTDVMILGHNPGLESPPLDRRFWDGESCDKAAWLRAWSPGPARKQMESKLLPCLAGLRVVECNLSHYRSKGYKDLVASQRVTDVFQVLIEILRPKLVVAFGSQARSYFDPSPMNLGKFMPHVVRGTPVQVFLGNHVIMGGASFWRDGGYELLRNGAQQMCRD